MLSLEAGAETRSNRSRDRPSRRDRSRWLDAMSPWPRDGFGLERMRALLDELGNPQEAYPRSTSWNEREVDRDGHDRAAPARGGALRRLDDLAARRVLERAHPDRRRRGRLRAGDRARPPGRRAPARRRSSRSSPRPPSPRSPTPRSTSRSSRPGSEVATTPRTSFAPASCCSRTSGSSTPTSSATRSRRSRPRSSPSHLRDADRRPPRRDVRRTSCRDASSVVGGAREAAEAFVGAPDRRRPARRAPRPP